MHAHQTSDAGLAEITAHEEHEHARLEAAKKEFARLESDTKKSYVSKEEAAHAHERKEATSALGRFEREELPRMVEEGEAALSAELQAINASAASQAPTVAAWLVDKLSTIAA